MYFQYITCDILKLFTALKHFIFTVCELRLCHRLSRIVEPDLLGEDNTALITLPTLHPASTR